MKHKYFKKRLEYRMGNHHFHTYNNSYYIHRPQIEHRSSIIFSPSLQSLGNSSSSMIVPAVREVDPTFFSSTSGSDTTVPAAREIDPTSFSSTSASGSTVPVARELNLNLSSSLASGSGITLPAARELNLNLSSSLASGSGITLPAARELNLNPSSSSTSGSGITLSAAKELNPNSSNSSTSGSGITLPVAKGIDPNTTSSSDEANGDKEFASINKNDLVSPNAKNKATEILKTISINDKKTTTKKKITDANQNIPYEKAQYNRALANILIEHVYNADEFNKNGDGKDNTLSTLTQERFMAFEEELKGGLTNLVKDLIKQQDIKVTERDNKGKAIKDSDGNDKIIVITDNFTRYLHDNELKTAIQKEIAERSRYQTPNGWEKVIQQYESTNNITSSSSNADANVASRGEDSEKKKRYMAAYNTALHISQKNSEGHLFKDNNSGPYNSIPRGRTGWGDYNNLKPSDFTKLVKAITNNIERYDQLNWQVMQIVKKLGEGKILTKEEQNVIDNIKQWQTEGATSKSMRNRIVSAFE